MNATGPTWILLSRDILHAASIQNQPKVIAILPGATGGILTEPVQALYTIG